MRLQLSLFTREGYTSKIKDLQISTKKMSIRYDCRRKSIWIHWKIVYTTKFQQNIADLTVIQSNRVNRIQSIHVRFRIQNLQKREQTGTFLFRIHAFACKRQNEFVTKLSGFVTNPEKSPLV